MTVWVGMHCDGDPWPTEHLRVVEDLGFDILTTGEHIVFHRPILEAISVLGYMAAATTKIKLAPATLLLPLRHPTVLAKQISSLDVLSAGRIILTVGVGGDYPREFEACEIPMNQRGIRANEGIEILKKYWSGERFDYNGRIFHLKDVDMMPLPVQPGGPPIWVSGRSEAAMRRAAILGDGWHPYMYTPAQARESFVKVREMATAAGRSLPEDYAFACFVYCSMYDDVSTAWDKAVEVLSYRYKMPFEKIANKYCAHGPPGKVADKLCEYVEAGVTKILVGLIMPPEERLSYLERFAAQVMPQVRNANLVKIL
jgi:probable F420-dependent oxidoreductase